MKIQLLPATTKWGKKMEKIIPKEQFEAYARLLVESLTGEKVEEVKWVK